MREIIAEGFDVVAVFALESCASGAVVAGEGGIGVVGDAIEEGFEVEDAEDGVAAGEVGVEDGGGLSGDEGFEPEGGFGEFEGKGVEVGAVDAVGDAVAEGGAEGGSGEDVVVAGADLGEAFGDAAGGGEEEVAQKMAVARTAWERGAWEEVVKVSAGVLELEIGNAEAKGLKEKAEKMLALWNVKTKGQYQQQTKNDVVLLLVPASFPILQVAFDVARRYPSVLVSYGDKTVTKLFVWNGYEWLALHIEDYLSGDFLQDFPGRVLLVGDDGQMPEGLRRGVPWCDKAKRIRTTERTELLYSIGDWLPFTPADWRWFADRYKVKLGKYVPKGSGEQPDLPVLPPK